VSSGARTTPVRQFASPAQDWVLVAVYYSSSKLHVLSVSCFREVVGFCHLNPVAAALIITFRFLSPVCRSVWYGRSDQPAHCPRAFSVCSFVTSSSTTTVIKIGSAVWEPSASFCEALSDSFISSRSAGGLQGRCIGWFG
jgi:hypothetical protein